MRRLLALAMLAGAAHAQLTITVSRQQTLSGIKAVKKLKLGVYQMVACGTGSVAGGEIVQSLVGEGFPVESSELATLAMMRAKTEGTLGLAQEYGALGAGLLAILQASGTIALAGPLAPLPAAAALALKLAKDRNDRYDPMILPLLKELLDPTQTIALTGGCTARYLLTAAGAKLTMRVVIAPPPPAKPQAFVRPPWALRPVEFTSVS